MQYRHLVYVLILVIEFLPVINQKISVTTFQSAHDTNSDNAISKFYWLNEKKDNAWDPLDKYSGMCSTKRLLKKCGCRIDRDKYQPSID